MRVLVCGGRDYRGDVSSVLDPLPVKLIIHGAARGADSLAEDYAKRREIPYVGVPAEWKLHGKAAGPMRNSKMLKDWMPNLVVAFPGGRGTENMIKQARVAGISVIIASPPATPK